MMMEATNKDQTKNSAMVNLLVKFKRIIWLVGTESHSGIAQFLPRSFSQLLVEAVQRLYLNSNCHL